MSSASSPARPTRQTTSLPVTGGVAQEVRQRDREQPAMAVELEIVAHLESRGAAGRGEGTCLLGEGPVSELGHPQPLAFVIDLARVDARERRQSFDQLAQVRDPFARRREHQTIFVGPARRAQRHIELRRPTGISPGE